MMRKNGLDSRHSWIVAISGSFVFLLATWPLKLGGQLFVSILDNIEADRNKAFLPFTLAFSIGNLSGPFVGLLGEKFGLQEVTLTGGILCTVGVGVCFFAEDIGLIAVCFGVIYGTGFGLSTLVVPEILCYHFDRHRTKALGIVLGGCGLGAFLTSPLLEKMLVDYGLSGALLIMSAVILNSVPFAMLLSVPKRKPRKNSIVQPPKDGTELNNIDCNNINDSFDSNMKSSYRHKVVVNTSQNTDFIEDDKNLKLTESQNDCPSLTLSDKSTFTVIKVLWSPPFLMITTIQSLNLFLQYTTWTITVDIARDKGIKQHQEAYFVMGLSLFEVIGSFTLSTINDCRWLTISQFSAVYFAIIGFTCLAVTWVYGFIATMIAICLLASINGGNSSALPSIVTEFIPKETRAMAMASRFILYAPLSFATSPLIGYFRGTLGSYNGLLYVMTSVGAICVVLLFILPRIANRKLTKG